MKNKKSILIIFALLVTGLAVWFFGIEQNSQTITMANQKGALAYNHSASNILDNVYQKNGLTILPFIYQDAEETISKSKVEEDFQKAGKTIKSISTNHIGTGTQIVTDTKTYNVIVFGDVDGDGYVDVFDAQSTLLHYVFGEEYSLTGLYQLAANVDNEDEIVDVFDAQRILLFYVGYEDDLVINKPTPTPDSGDSGTGGSGGSTGGGTTNKDTQAPVITLTEPNPQYITLGNEYIELGAEVTDNKDTNPTLSIDSSEVNTDEEGEYTVTYTAKDASGNTATATRKVIVQKPVSKIEIVTEPSKTTYKVSEDIDVTGGQIEVTDELGNTTTIPMEKYMISGYDSTKAGTQTITVTHRGATDTFTVTVEDYIIGIEITSTDHKITHVYGEALDTSKLVIKAIYAGSTESTQIQISNLVITGHTATQLGEQTITIKYTTTNTKDGKEDTFETTYNVTVTNKPLENIVVTPKSDDIVGYRYQTFEIATVSAATGEEPITSSALSFKITDASNNNVSTDIAKATVPDNQFGGTITISFMSKEAGTYKITPMVGTVTGTTIEVEVEEDPTVNNITFSGTIEGNFRVGHTKQIGVTFTHVYDEEENIETQINVAANRVTVEGIEYNLISTKGQVIDVTANPNEYVAKIELAPETARNQTTIKVLIDGKEVATFDTIDILPVAEVYVKLADTSDITLYTATPDPEDSMVKEINNKFYTLREIYLEDEDGNKTAVTMDDLTKENIQIVDSLYTPEDLFVSIDVKAFIEQSGSIVETTTGEIKYIGIALKEGAETLLIDEQIIITYKEDITNQIKLDIIMPAQKITEVNVTPKSDDLVGYRYQTFEIATVSSGENQAEITENNLEYEVKEVIENVEYEVDLKTSTNISITLEEPANQLTKESTIKFMAKEAGTYRITPKVGTVTGTTVEVVIEEDPTVNKITFLGTINKEENFRVGHTQQIGITFTHVYDEEENIETPINVEANRVTVEGIEYNLISAKGVIDVATNPNEYVTKIELAPETAREQTTIKVLIDGKEAATFDTIDILPVAEIYVKLADTSGITLYTATPDPEDSMVKEINNKFYTLREIYLEDEDGNKTAVTMDDLTKGNIQIVDSLYTPEDLFVSIDVKAFIEQSGSIVETTTGEIKYIGIALKEGAETLLIDEQVIITYKEDITNQIKLDINIPVQKITEVNVTPKSDLYGYRYKPFEIATVSSGTNQEEITEENLEYEVKKVIEDVEQEVDLETIEITLIEPANQFTKESTIQFMAKEAGTYKITPKVGTVTGDPVEVEIEEDPTVTTIRLTGISDNDVLAIGGKAKRIGIEFIHEYEENVESTIEVEASRITVEADEIEYDLLTEGKVSTSSNPSLKVGLIDLWPTETATQETKTITITVDNGETEDKSIKINVTVEPLTITVGNTTQITLYTSKTGDDPMVQDENGTIYTLLQIELNDGTKLTQDDFTSETVQVLDEDADPDFPISTILTPTYYKTVDGVITKTTSQTDPIEYIGISAGSDTSSMSGKKVIIYYNGEPVITLEIVLG